MVFAFQMQSTVVAIFRELEEFPTWFGRGAVAAQVREEEGEGEEEREEGEGERVGGHGQGDERSVALAEEGMSHPLLGMRPTASDHGKLRGMTTVICLAGALLPLSPIRFLLPWRERPTRTESWTPHTAARWRV